MALQLDRLSIIIRLHTVEGEALSFLDQALFSVVHATHRPIEVIIVTQQFTEAQTEQAEHLLSQYAWDKSCQMRLVPFQHPERRDHRSALMNFGIAAAQGQYLAFLDYDDYVYPEAYELLIGQLKRSACAVAFGGCLVSHATATTQGWKTLRKVPMWREKSESEFLTGNLFPIHSFVIDRQRLQNGLPRFNENSCHMEDYEFLLRLRLITPFDLTLWKRILVEYVMRDDGSNTLFVEESQATPAKKKAWWQAYTALEPLREEVAAYVRGEAVSAAG